MTKSEATCLRLLNAAVRVARKPGGWSTMTRHKIALEAGCSDALVSVHLGTMQNARRVIIEVAIREKILEIIAQSVAANDAYKIPISLKHKALLSL